LKSEKFKGGQNSIVTYTNESSLNSDPHKTIETAGKNVTFVTFVTRPEA